MADVYAIATMDSKGPEIAYIADLIKATGQTVKLVDVGTKVPASVQPDINRERIAACHPGGADQVLGLNDRGQAVTAMGEALAQFIQDEFAAGNVKAVIGIGGTGGTALITPAMRALPIGVPKLMVSTVASGNTAPYVDCCDICMMYSVVDVAGVNAVSRVVLGNAAHAIAGMCKDIPTQSEDRPCIGLTMFGVTTPCVTRICSQLEEKGFAPLVFHATGTGGRAMEKLVASGLIQGVIDVTTTEICDEVVGGVFASGPQRFDAIAAAEIPYVASLGACDMVNFAAQETVPPQFKERNLYVHNSNVTLMRTTADELQHMADWMCAKWNTFTSPMHLVIPQGGVSLIDVPEAPFYDAEANASFFTDLKSAYQQDDLRHLLESADDINADAFADLLTHTFIQAWEASQAAAV